MILEAVRALFRDESRAVKVTGYHPRDPVLAEWLAAGQDTLSGITVTPTNSMNFLAVLRCIKLISGQISTLPFNVCRRISDKQSEVIEDHPVHQLLNARPNPYRRAQKFREALTAHAVSWGNGYAEIERDGAGRPISLTMLRPDRVRPKTNGEGAIVYEWQSDSQETKNLRQDQVLHVAGLGYDDLMGYSVLSLAREAIGLGLAGEAFNAAFYGNSGMPSGFLKHPGKLSTEAQKKLREQWHNVHGGPRKAGKTAVLEEGMDYAPLAMIPQKDAQFLESRQFQVIEICRAFDVPPHLVFELDRATYANSEQHWIEFVGGCLRYWENVWQDACEQSLLTPDELADGYYLKHDDDKLVVPDMKTRFEAYGTGIDRGYLTPNMVLRLEGKNDVGPEGDLLRWPINNIPADKAEAWADAQIQSTQAAANPPDASQGDPNTPDGGGPEPKTGGQVPANAPTEGPSPIPYVTDGRALNEAILGVFKHQLTKIARLERERVCRAANKADGFVSRIDEFFGDQHREHVERELLPAATAYAAATGRSMDLRRVVGEHCDSLKQSVLDESGRSLPADLESNVSKLTAGWEESMPAAFLGAHLEQIGA